MRETDNWEFIKARWFTPVAAPRYVRGVCIHDMEYPERMMAARDVGKFFATIPNDPKKKASAHIGVDNEEVIQYVKDNNVAYGCPGVNHDMIHVELAGYSSQARRNWMDPYGVKLLTLAGDAVAQYCLKYNLPAKHLTNRELLEDQKGIIGHYQASQVYRLSDHTDPGPNFPWDYFMATVARQIAFYTD